MLSAQNNLGNYILREENSKEFLKSIIPTGSLTSESALKVYRNDYIARLTSVLGENYEATWAVLGDELFFEVCGDFIKKNNSKSFDIGEYGQTFYLFLKEHPIGLEYPFLSDLAFFEKNFLRVFHSPVQNSNFKISKDQNLTEGRLKFIEGIHLQKSLYPIYKIWELKNTPCDQRNNLKIDWNERCNLVLYKNRSGIKTSFFREGQVVVIENLCVGKKISESLPENITSLEVEEIFKFISTSGILLDVIYNG